MVFLTVLGAALLPAIGNFAGALLAESVRTPKWVIGVSLHAAAGIAIAVVSIELMPRVLDDTPMWLIVSSFMVGAVISVLLARSVTRSIGGITRAWMVFVAISADLFSDGLMTGVGSAVASGLGFLIAISQCVANVPGGFAATANLRANAVAPKLRIILAASLAIPVMISAVLGFWFLRDASTVVQNAMLCVIMGILLVTTIEDVLPEADAPQPPRWISTLGFAGGFVTLSLLSTYLK